MSFLADATPVIGPSVTVEQAASQPDPARLVPISFTATFSEPVTGLTSGDVTLGGTAGATTVSVTGSGAIYNLAVSGMTGEGSVTVSLPAGAAQNAGGDPSLASTSMDNTVTFDAVRPVLLSLARQDPAIEFTDQDSLTFRATFDEEVVPPVAADFAVDGGSLAQVTSVAAVSPSVYDLIVTGGDLAGYNGPLGINLRAAQSIEDLAGNQLPTQEPPVDESYLVSNAGGDLDLSISKSDGRAVVGPGGLLDYVLLVRNSGPAAAAGARVVDRIPTGLAGATWVCSAGPGASCAASGNSDIDDTVTLLAGTEVVYTLSATASAPIEAVIENVASVSPPAGVTDLAPEDNEATDLTTIEEVIFADSFEEPPGGNGKAVLSWLPRLLLGDPARDDVLLHQRTARGREVRESFWDPAGFWVPGPWMRAPDR